MKYGIIGCSRIASSHVDAALANGLDIAAVCDINPDQTEKLLKKHGLSEAEGIRKYVDYKKMIDENEFDLVAIAAKSDVHAEIAMHCIQQGVNVIIEKPMAMSMSDADEIVRLSDEKNVRVAACHQKRFGWAVQKTRNALENGRFGKLSHGSVHVRWNRDKDYYEQSPWRGTWAQDGGTMMNQCIHGIDLLCWLMGDDVEEVYGAIRRRFHSFIETEDVGMAVLKFKSGAIATIEGTTNVYPKNLEETLYIFGEKGTVKIGGKSANEIDIWNFEGEEYEDNMYAGNAGKNPFKSEHDALYADMISAIRDGRSPYVDAHAGRNALEVVLAIYKSQKEGRAVKLPIDDFASINMKGEVI